LQGRAAQLLPGEQRGGPEPGHLVLARGGFEPGVALGGAGGPSIVFFSIP